MSGAVNAQRIPDNYRVLPKVSALLSTALNGRREDKHEGEFDARG
jgi:hypothetical protein